MESDRGSRSGGSAAAGGFEYQKLVTAWAAAQMLAETAAAANRFELGSSAFTILRTETEQPVDDLLLMDAAGGIVCAQIKRSLDAGSSPRSPLGVAIAQVVRQMIRSRTAPATANPQRPWDRALDNQRDRIAVISKSMSARFDVANRLLRQLRAYSAALEQLCTTDEERSIFGVLREHVTRVWQEETGGPATDADVLACLLPLVFVELDVESAGRDETGAKSVLQQVLGNSSQLDACWTELVTFAGALITRRGGADRSALQNYLETRGIKLFAATSYRADIERLREYGARTQRDLASFAGLRVGDETVHIPRDVVDELASSAATERSLLVTGDPGAGKSGAVHDLAERLSKQAHDVVVLAVDRIAAESLSQLRVELDLEHDLVDVLGNWPGDTPAYLIIDALDAARARETAQLVRDLLTQLIETPTRWRVVASIREFDLLNSPQLQALFAGVPPGRYAAQAFRRLRHVHVPHLSETELQFLWQRAPAFAVIFERSDDATRDLLRVPFNLRLFADLFTAGVDPSELTAIRTRGELLEGYWKWRVLGEADPDGDAREQVLRVIAATMIKHRSLQAVRSDLPGTLDSAALMRLHSNGVLTPWTVPGTAEPERAVITFSHHVLFDYAASRLLLRGTSETLVARLTDDPEFILSFRPSAMMHFEYLWLREEGRVSFWTTAAIVAAAEVLPAIAKTIAPAVAVAAARAIADFTELLRLLSERKPGAEHTVRHVFGALLAADRAAQPLVGTTNALWAQLLRATAADLTPITAYAIRPTLMDSTEQIDQATDDERRDLWVAATFLLTFARAQASDDLWLSVQAVRAVCRTYNVDTAASRGLLLPIVSADYPDEHSTEELYWIAREIERIMPIDPDFVRRVYEVAFAYRVFDDRKMSLGGGALLNLTTSTRQHHESILHSLGESFAAFLTHAPASAIETTPSLIETHIRDREATTLGSSAMRFAFLGGEVELCEDGSHIWDAWSSVGHALSPVLDALESYLSQMAVDDAGIALLRLFGSVTRAAVGWRRLLRAAAKSPAGIGRAVIELAYAEQLLYAHDTTTEAGRFIAAVYPYASASERATIEQAILRGAKDRNPVFSRRLRHLRDRLLGAIPSSLLTTPQAVAEIAAVTASGGAPPNDDLFEISGGAMDYTDEDYLRDLHVPVESGATQRLLAVTGPVQKFASDYLNSVPERQAVDDILPRLQELAVALADESLHQGVRDYGWGHLVEAADRITRIASFDEAPFADMIVDTLRSGTEQRQPLPEEDSAFKTPSWGSPAARIYAAQGWMRISRYARFVDTTHVATIRRLAVDPAPSVRFQIANDMRGLYRTAPELLWELIDRFGEHENSLGVLQGFMSTLQAIAPHHPDRVVPTVRSLVGRIPEDKDARAVRDAAFNIIAGLYLWQSNQRCSDLIIAATADLAQRTNDCSRIASECGRVLEDDPDAPPDAVAAARRRALASLDSLLAAARSVMEAADHTDPEVVRQVASFVTHIGLFVYRITGDSRRGTPAADVAVRYSRIAPLVEKLVTFGVPMLAHHLLNSLEALVPADPAVIFMRIGEVVESARRYGYEYESEAVRIIVRLLKRYMADYPDVVRSPEGQRTFLQTLDTFVQVGWPDARKLTYHLEEAFR
jgi:ArgK protein.